MTSSSGRPELASLILSHGPRINEAPVDADAFESLCERLRQAPVHTDDVVVLSGLSGRELVTATLAVWRCDAVPMPVAAGSDPPSAVRTASRITADLAVVPAAGDHRPAGLATTAVLHTSSGSTGQPKVAKRGVRSVLLEADGYRAGLSLVPDDRVAVPIPLAHSLGWGVALSALTSGCDVDVTRLVRASTLSRKIDSGQVTVVALTAPLARLLVATRRTGHATLRSALVGAGQVTDGLDAAFRTRFGQSLLRGYGCSETGGTFLGDHGMGRPVPGVEIVAPSRGGQGELVLRIDAPVEGYLGEDTTPTTEWHTGDIVRYDADAVMYFVERSRGQLRLNGRFVDSAAIAHAVRSAPGVRDVYLLVLPRPGTPEVEDLYAVIEGNDVDTTSIRDHLAGHGPDTPVPQVLTCAHLPRTVVGKPDRAAVIDLLRKENAFA